ncbi:MAG: tyrosine-type recombinase/integrase [Thermoplasmata archaeon]|nr:tyrosine-type recombinase/integrase [Thermoplasmata archaeon]
MPKKKKSLPIYLTVDEIRRMLSAAKNERDRLMVLLAYKTGLRCHEITSLKIEHIDFEKNLIMVVDGKGNRDRMVYVDPDTIKQLREYIGERRSGIVFLSQKNTPRRKVKRTILHYDEEGNVVKREVRWVTLERGQLNDATLERIVRNMARDAGIVKPKRVTTHTLRHTFACQSLLAGVPITTVQIALGHASLKTTEIYLRAIQNTEQLIKDYQKNPLPV